MKITEPGRTPLHLVVRRPVEVGRDCDGLLLADAELSRRHLRLSATGGRVTVQDLGSTNGTQLDGSVLIGPTGVEVGQVVTFGRCELEVVPAGASTNAREAVESDPLRRTSIDIVAAAAAADPMPVSELLSQGGTLTIVFSDIEQSTRRGDALGDEAWLELLRFHNSLVRRHVERNGGVEIKSQGDGFMLAFSSAARRGVVLDRDHACARCARAVAPYRCIAYPHRDAHGRGDRRGRRPVRQARRARRAHREPGAAGEILVSSLVREIVASRGDLAFGATRQVELKGLAGSHSLHSVDWMRRDG